MKCDVQRMHLFFISLMTHCELHRLQNAKSDDGCERSNGKDILAKNCRSLTRPNPRHMHAVATPNHFSTH